MAFSILCYILSVYQMTHTLNRVWVASLPGWMMGVRGWGGGGEHRHAGGRGTGGMPSQGEGSLQLRPDLDCSRKFRVNREREREREREKEKGREKWACELYSPIPSWWRVLQNFVECCTIKEYCWLNRSRIWVEVRGMRMFIFFEIVIEGCKGRFMYLQ